MKTLTVGSLLFASLAFASQASGLTLDTTIDMRCGADYARYSNDTSPQSQMRAASPIDILESLDLNSDGVVHVQDARDEPYALAVFYAMDFNGNGQVTVEEALHHYRVRWSERQVSEFNRLDVRRNNHLAEHEYRHSQLPVSFAEADLSGDGAVSIDEFLMAARLASINNDEGLF